MSKQAKHFYDFGPLRIDPAERVLLRDGRPLTLTPKAFDLLLALVERSGHVVEKEELMSTVWPGTAVEESNLTHHISVLRKALGETAEGHPHIETIPRRGYRFTAQVNVQNSAAVKPALEGLATLVGADDIQPVVPGVSFPAWRGRGSAIILIVLASLALVLVGLRLDFWLGNNAAVRELEFKGNFYTQMWTEDEVRKGIEYYNRAVALDPHSASAYAGLATGWNFLSDLHVSPREAQPKAKAAAVKALQLDETYAQAHVSLGLIKTQYEWDWAGAEQEFKRAIALNPDHEPAHELYGWYLVAVGRFDEAEAKMKRAAEANPLADIHLWELGLCFYFEGKYDQAIEQYRRAIGVDSRSYWSHMLLGWAYVQQGKHDEAVAALNQANRINDCPQVLASLGHAYAVSGRRSEAQKVIEELRETALHRYVSPYDVATIYAGMGDEEQTVIWLEKAYEDRSGWLGLWIKVDPKFDSLRQDPRFQDLLRRVGHAT